MLEIDYSWGIYQEEEYRDMKLKCSNCKENWENGSGSGLCNACTNKGLTGELPKEVEQNMREGRSKNRQKQIAEMQNLLQAWNQVDENWDLLKSGGSGAIAQTKWGEFNVCTHSDGNLGGYIGLNNCFIDTDKNDAVKEFVKDVRKEFPCPCLCKEKK